MKLEIEYNPSKSVQYPIIWIKMYAELIRNRSIRTIR
nr:MAG TPA: hypothetical protein [Caudoviricetes sp.]DAM64169.1 MAG TPA: hypothetical protein [Crassvirales sp.]